MLSSVSTWNHDESWALLPIAVMNAASGLFLKDVLEVRPHDLDFPQAVPLCATMCHLCQIQINNGIIIGYYVDLSFGIIIDYY
jgi:hypothetical protein